MQNTEICKHPPSRLYSWFTHNTVTNQDDWLCITCCECGDVLKGSAEDYDTYLISLGYDV